MLGKLLKYEMKASARTLLPLYLGTLIVAVICAVQAAMMVGTGNVNGGWWIEGPLDSGVITGFIFLLFFALCVAIMVLTAMIAIQRFNKSLIGDEGYLMFTLPVTHTQLLNSKLIASLLWVVVGTIVMGLASLIIFMPVFLAVPDMDWAYFWNEVQYMLSQYNPFSQIALSVVAGLLTIVATILTVYLSIMIGQMEQCSKYRVAVSVVMFFVINWLFSLIGTSVLNVLSLDWNNYVVSAAEFSALYNKMMAVGIAGALIQCAICFAAVVWMMKKKLNL